MVPDGPASVSIEKQTYKTGFYGTLFPDHFDCAEEAVTVGGIEYQRIEHETFNLLHADVGQYAEGTIYCDERQYAEAQRYYSEPQNFSYYCIIGVDSDDTVAQTVELNNIEASQFEALLNFADDSEYMPFASTHNGMVEKVELPMPDDKTTRQLIFYKKSIDSLFVSNSGHAYYIVDGTLYFVYQYDFGRGEYEKLIAVRVPSEISDYFVEYMEPYL